MKSTEVFKIKKVKQVTKDIIRVLFSGYDKAGEEIGIGDFTVFPNAWRVYTASRNVNGEFNTGLTEKEEKYYGALIGQDLSKRSDFWKNFRVTLNSPEGQIQFDEANVYDVLKMKMAIASGYLAPTLTDLKEQKHKYRDTVFYLYEQDEDNSRKRRELELSDALTSKIYEMRNDKEKMILAGFLLGKAFTEAYTLDTMYTELTNYRKGLKGIESFEAALAVLEKTPSEQQARYYFTKSVGKPSLIVQDYDSNSYYYEGKFLGIGKEASIEMLQLPENQSLLNGLIKNYKALYSKKK